MIKLEALRNHVIDACKEALDQPGSAPETWAALKSIEDLVSEMKDMLKEVTISELVKYGKEGLSKNGLRMSVKSGSGRYIFTGNPQWVEADARKKKIEEAAKLAARTNGIFVDEDGVVQQPAVYIAGADTVVCEKLK